MKAHPNRLAATITTLVTVALIGLANAEPPPPEKAPPPVLELRQEPEVIPIAPPPALVEPERAAVSEEVFRIARLAANERGLRSAGRPAVIDAYLIAETLERNARVNEVSIVEWIAEHHTRHTRASRTDPRRWVAYLSATLERPEGWPESRIPWATDDRGQRAWERLLGEVETWDVGGRVSVCPVASPWTWGGSGIQGDRDRLIRMLESGENRIVAGPSFPGEPPGARRPEEQCEVDGVTLASNVFLAKVRELERNR